MDRCHPGERDRHQASGTGHRRTGIRRMDAKEHGTGDGESGRRLSRNTWRRAGCNSTGTGQHDAGALSSDRAAPVGQWSVKAAIQRD